jgi:3,4-dihydroxy-9,10-secoandrosta-1,3,5(10)-triene-9,17-dione 4,5-dioxygenase
MIDTRALGYVVIETTDLAKWEHFGTRVMGLMVAPSVQEDGVLYLKMDEYPYRLRIVEGAADRFAVAGWEVAGPQEFATALRELEAAGIACERASAAACAARLLSEMVAFTAPGGLRCELFYYMRLDYLPLISPVGVGGFVTGFNGTMGLGHIAAATPDLDASHRFFTAVMGFGQTDYLHLHFSPDPADPGQGLHFLHANNPRHHSLALFQSTDPLPGDLVHLMVEVPDLDTLGGFMDRVHANGVRVITCLGRHTNDRMVSIYVETPAGFALEYGFDGLQLDWSTYVPTFSKRESHWGHRWGQG